MRKSNSSLLGKYSDGSYKRKGKKEAPAIVEYKQLYKGEIKAKTVTEKKYITLDEKIKARTKSSKEDEGPRGCSQRAQVSARCRGGSGSGHAARQRDGDRRRL